MAFEKHRDQRSHPSRSPEKSKAPPRTPEKSADGPRTDWGDVAEWYNRLVGESGSEYHRHVVVPGVMRMLNVGAGDNVVDIACGQGVLCRILAQRGIDVTGIDAASELIEAAKKHGPDTIRYKTGDARDLKPLANDEFSAAALVLAIQNIHPLPPMCSELARVLKPGGRVVIVMMHPCFRGPKTTSWGWDDSAGIQYRRVDRYLLPRKEPIVTHPGQSHDQYTWTFHRPIETYIKALRNAGLLVDAIEEWASHKHSDSGPRAAAENRSRKEIPLFMAIRAVKVRGGHLASAGAFFG